MQGIPENNYGLGMDEASSMEALSEVSQLLHKGKLIEFLRSFATREFGVWCLLLRYQAKL
jgi:hypothetical protein